MVQADTENLRAVSSGLALRQTLYTDDDGVVSVLAANGYTFVSVLALRARTDQGYENTYLYAPISKTDLALLIEGRITAREAITGVESEVVLCAVNKRLGATSPGIWSEMLVADIPDAWLPRPTARCVEV